MTTKKLLSKLLSIVALIVVASITATAEDRFTFNGNLTPGVQLSNDPSSSKFNEYRDIKDGLFVPGIGASMLDTETGRYAEINGSSIFRDDQNIRARLGKYSHWKLGLEWDEIPHLLSNKAMTPYAYDGSGRYTVPATVPDTNSGFVKKLVPTAAELTGTNDPATATYLAQYLHSTNLGNQRNKGSANLEYMLFDDLKFRFNYSLENRDGNKITYGPIGDRPPRTLNIQLPEPIDYKTQEFKLESDYLGESYQVNTSYQISDFKNNVDAMTWQNIYSNATGAHENWGGSTARSVATFGSRALPPDNRYQNVSATFGLDLPFESRFTATGTYGWLRQDQTLLPYSTNDTADSSDSIAWNSTTKLPRTTAEAKMNTKLFNADYAINPIDRLNLKASFRYFDLDNKTSISDWKYATSDTTGTTGSVSYVNKRRNLAYAYDKRNIGLDANYGFDFWHTSIGAGFEREGINRVFREANTNENIYRTSLRTRPTDWLHLSSKYQYGNRDASDYNYHVTSASYWYSASEASDKNDPQFTFDNHPDMRRYDVTDRKQKKFDLVGTF
ncbi:MAG: MtrB/PioB family outer membrane beta-barrel protein, partial [Bdellovibrionota bacterium]